MPMSAHQRGQVNIHFDPPPRLVLFDLDDTLCDYDNALVTRIRYAFEPWFDSPEQLEAAVRDQLAASDWEGGEHFQDVLTRHGRDDASVIDEARARFIEDRYRGLCLFDEALEVVETIAEVMSVGIITNGPSDIQWPKIRLLGIENHFPVIVVSGDVGVWKPDPRIFEIALERCGFTAEDAIYVGDSIEADMPGARAAGVRSVWMNRARHPWHDDQPPDAIIHSLHDLLPLVGIASEAH
jgi:HAD superfamily hydrolase (TIGR01509 family)